MAQNKEVKDYKAGGDARQGRSDGEATKAHIIEAAGQLFAEHGYAATTAKEVCSLAGTNTAAINYHFGGRDGLYIALLEEAHKYFMPMDFLEETSKSALPPREKLARLVREFVLGMLDTDKWATRLWIREVLAPSPLFPELLRGTVRPKFEIMKSVVAAVLELPPENPKVQYCLFNTISPCLFLLTAPAPGKELFSLPLAGDPDKFVKVLTEFILGGLEAVKARPGL